jgi:hypothetical protein
MLWWVLSTGAPSGAAGVRVIELHLPDPLWPPVPAFFNWDLSYNTASKVSISLLVTLNFPWKCCMHVCVEMRFGFVYYVAVT